MVRKIWIIVHVLNIGHNSKGTKILQVKLNWVNCQNYFINKQLVVPVEKITILN